METQLVLNDLDGFKVQEKTCLRQKENRLFLPLNEKWYNLFLAGDKEWELRGMSSQFNLQTVTKGKSVELRKGYKNSPVWGTIEDVFTVDSIDKIPTTIYDKVIPISVQNEQEVIDFISFYSEKYDKMIVFKISLLKNI